VCQKRTLAWRHYNHFMLMIVMMMMK